MIQESDIRETEDGHFYHPVLDGVAAALMTGSWQEHCTTEYIIQQIFAFMERFAPDLWEERFEKKIDYTILSSVEDALFFVVKCGHFTVFNTIDLTSEEIDQLMTEEEKSHHCHYGVKFGSFDRGRMAWSTELRCALILCVVEYMREQVCASAAKSITVDGEKLDRTVH